MLTTPAMASEPYTAEAPSLRISRRSMAAAGIEFRSTELFAPVPPGTKRRPLRSTRVRFAPRPRRLTRVEPSPPLLTEVLIALPCAGRLWRKSPMETLPLAATRSLEMMVTGAGEVRSLRRMREPVTRISSSALFFVPALGVEGPPATGSSICKGAPVAAAGALGAAVSPGAGVAGDVAPGARCPPAAAGSSRCADRLARGRSSAAAVRPAAWWSNRGAASAARARPAPRTGMRAALRAS